MKHCTWVLVGLLCLVLFPSDATASPNPRDCHDQVLLGANQDHFYYLNKRMVAPGNYYENSEIVTLCKKSFSTFEVTEEHLVAKRHHKREPNSLENTTTVEDVAKFDLQSYLLSEGVNYAGFTRPGPVVFVDGALYVEREGRRALLMNKEAVERQLGTLGPQPTVLYQVSVYTPRDWSYNMQFYLVWSIGQDSDCTNAAILAVSRAEWEAVWSSLKPQRR